MQHSFKTIREAINCKYNCPICSSPLKTEFDNIFKDRPSIISFDGNIVNIEITLGDESILKVQIPTDKNDFTYCVDPNFASSSGFKVSDYSLEDLGNSLNHSYPTLYKTCQDCEYYLTFRSLKFDFSLKKVQSIIIMSEHINLIGIEYQIYNDFVEQQTRIISLTDNSLVKCVNQILNLNKSEEELTELVKTIVTFS